MKRMPKGKIAFLLCHSVKDDCYFFIQKSCYCSLLVLLLSVALIETTAMRFVLNLFRSAIILYRKVEDGVVAVSFARF